jgi:hypothetical protein
MKPADADDHDQGGATVIAAVSTLAGANFPGTGQPLLGPRPSPRSAHFKLTSAAHDDLATSREPPGLPGCRGDHTDAPSDDHGQFCQNVILEGGPGKRADLIVAAGDPLDDIKLLPTSATSRWLCRRPHGQAHRGNHLAIIIAEALATSCGSFAREDFVG